MLLCTFSSPRVFPEKDLLAFIDLIEQHGQDSSDEKSAEAVWMDTGAFGGMFGVAGALVTYIKHRIFKIASRNSESVVDPVTLVPINNCNLWTIFLRKFRQEHPKGTKEDLVEEMNNFKNKVVCYNWSLEHGEWFAKKYPPRHSKPSAFYTTVHNTVVFDNKTETEKIHECLVRYC